MDTSETYIKMRLCAIPYLGRGCSPEKQLNRFKGNIWIDYAGNWYYTTELNGQDAVQLERQDQLQIISGLTWKQFDVKCQRYDSDTKEQAGLQAVMAVVYKKTWQNNEWKLDNTI